MKKFLTLALAFVALAGFIGLDVAQGQQPQVPCPTPRHIHLTAPLPVAATPFAADFPAVPPVGLEPNFGGTTMDKHFRHTFTFPPPSELCCQCVEGKNTLTIRYKALQGGAANSSSSANDTMGIIVNGVTASSLQLFSGKVTTGQIGTKTIPLKCSWLTNNRLSFAFQDDTSVISATLDLDFCCVKK
jgi:hypothetical protein